MRVVLQIVINNGFYCRKSYRLLKRHQNSTLHAISRRYIITLTLIVLFKIGIHVANSQPTIARNKNVWALDDMDVAGIEHHATLHDVAVT
jgi:hypothetical protein